MPTSVQELVQHGDPDRFAATLIASPAHRRQLLALFAFNLELAATSW